MKEKREHGQHRVCEFANANDIKQEEVLKCIESRDQQPAEQDVSEHPMEFRDLQSVLYLGKVARHIDHYGS